MRTTTDLHPARRARPGGHGPGPTTPHGPTARARRAVTLAGPTGADAHRPDARRCGGTVVADRAGSSAAVPAGVTSAPADGFGAGRDRARRGRARTVARVVRARVVRGRVVAGSDAGMATAEYAIATVAAVGFAGLLMVVLRSGEVQGLLLGLVRGALSV